MGNVVLNLGGVAFQDFEVPEKIGFGGTQRLAVHELIGGGRVVDVLGVDDGEIAFAGVFSGNNAVARAQALDAARAAGAEIPLSWEGFFYTVVIATFLADYQKPWWIPFSVRCAVVSDPVAALAALVAPVANLLSSDIAAAGGYGVLAGVSLAGLAVPAAGAFASARSQISAAIAVAGAGVATHAAGVAVAPDAVSGIAAVNGALGCCGQLAGLAAVSGYVNRAAVNFAGGLS